MFRNVLAITFAAAAASLIGALPAHALSTKECGVLYQTAKDANKLKGATWNEFRKAKCGAEAAAEEPVKAEKKPAAKKTAAAAANRFEPVIPLPPNSRGPRRLSSSR